MKLSSSLVDVEWLVENAKDDDLIILDASWHMPAANRDGFKEWQAQCIPGARFFDFDGAIKDQNNPLPHMLPSAELFTEEVRKLGVNDNSQIVIYDSFGVRSSARGWWMFRAMGHQDVAVLDGGLPAWLAAGHAGEKGQCNDAAATGNFVADYQPGLVKNIQQVDDSMPSDEMLLLDARSEGRFNATEPEPRPELRAGHIPGSKSLAYDLLLNDGHMIAPNALQVLFEDRIEADESLIFSCGSGVTAAVLALGADLAGLNDYAVYDGSWTEWADPALTQAIDS